MRQGGKIKIPLWPAVNLSADCSEKLLRDGIPNDTAAAIATNCFDLIYFSFYNPPHHHHHLHPVLLLSLPTSLSPFPSVVIDTYYVHPVHMCDSISSSAPRQWQATSVSRSPCHTALESGEVAHSTGQSGKACGQSRAGLAQI